MNAMLVGGNGGNGMVQVVPAVSVTECEMW
jgi:hypothetical protein